MRPLRSSRRWRRAAPGARWKLSARRLPWPATPTRRAGAPRARGSGPRCCASVPSPRRRRSPPPARTIAPAPPRSWSAPSSASPVPIRRPSDAGSWACGSASSICSRRARPSATPPSAVRSSCSPSWPRRCSVSSRSGVPAPLARPLPPPPRRRPRGNRRTARRRRGRGGPRRGRPGRPPRAAGRAGCPGARRLGTTRARPHQPGAGRAAPRRRTGAVRGAPDAGAPLRPDRVRRPSGGTERRRRGPRGGADPGRGGAPVKRWASGLGAFATLALLAAAVVLGRAGQRSSEVSALAAAANVGPRGLAGAGELLRSTGAATARRGPGDPAVPDAAVVLLAAPSAALDREDVPLLVADAARGATVVVALGRTPQPELLRALGLELSPGEAPRLAHGLAPHRLVGDLSLPGRDAALSPSRPGAHRRLRRARAGPARSRSRSVAGRSWSSPGRTLRERAPAAGRRRLAGGPARRARTGGVRRTVPLAGAARAAAVAPRPPAPRGAAPARGDGAAPRARAAPRRRAAAADRPRGGPHRARLPGLPGGALPPRRRRGGARGPGLARAAPPPGPPLVRPGAAHGCAGGAAARLRSAKPPWRSPAAAPRWLAAAAASCSWSTRAAADAERALGDGRRQTGDHDS